MIIVAAVDAVDDVVGDDGDVTKLVKSLFVWPVFDWGRLVRWVKPNILLLNLLNRFDAILANYVLNRFSDERGVRKCEDVNEGNEKRNKLRGNSRNGRGSARKGTGMTEGR